MISPHRPAEEDTFPREPLGLAHVGGSDLAQKLAKLGDIFSNDWDLWFVSIYIYILYVC